MKLKDCPFCGGEDIETSQRHVRGTTYITRYECQDCTAQANAWNTRVPDKDRAEIQNHLKRGLINTMTNETLELDKLDELYESQWTETDGDTAILNHYPALAAEIRKLRGFNRALEGIASREKVILEQVEINLADKDRQIAELKNELKVQAEINRREK